MLDVWANYFLPNEPICIQSNSLVLFVYTRLKVYIENYLSYMVIFTVTLTLDFDL